MSEDNVSKILVEVITELSKKIAVGLTSKFTEKLKDKYEKDNIDFYFAFKEYLEYSLERQEKIKTLLYSNSPVKLQDIYQCANLKNKNVIINSKNIEDVLSIGNEILITGTGGIGKTLLLKNLFIECIMKTEQVPVFIELRKLKCEHTTKEGLQSYIHESLKRLTLDIEDTYFEYSLKGGHYLILLDGYDEVNEKIRINLDEAIKMFCDYYPDNHYIISSRPTDNFINFSNFTELECQPLTKNQALSLIRKNEKINDDDVIREKLGNFHKDMKKTLFSKHNSFASNPLLLTMMLITYMENAFIPDKLNDFYESSFNALYSKHDGTKGFERIKKSGLGCSDFKNIFSFFCFKSFFKSEYEFTENQALGHICEAKNKVTKNYGFQSKEYLDDLTDAVCMLIKEGRSYKFSHRSFQEYFAAIYARTLTDDQQKKFFKSYIICSYTDTDFKYFEILNEFEPERFFQNVMLHGLTELKKEYTALEKDNEIIYYLFLFREYPGVLYNLDSEKRNENCVKRARYLNNIICLTYNLYGKMNTLKKYRNLEEEKILEIKFLKFSAERKFFVDIKPFKNGVEYFVKKIGFCLEILESYEKKSKCRDDDYLAMLREL